MADDEKQPGSPQLKIEEKSQSVEGPIDRISIYRSWNNSQVVDYFRNELEAELEGVPILPKTRRESVLKSLQGKTRFIGTSQRSVASSVSGEEPITLAHSL